MKQQKVNNKGGEVNLKKVFINANVITMNKNMPNAKMFIVENNKFVYVGESKNIESLICEGYEVIDLEGKTIVPGFNESHVHMLNFGYSLSKIDCNGIKSIEEIIKISKEYISENNIEHGKWVCGRGWNQTHFKEKRIPNRHDLDRISTKHPIVFTRICEHIVVANSMALELANIRKDTKDPDGGEIERDDNNEITGVLKESARYLVYSKIPDASVEEIKNMLLKATNVAASYGVTTVQSDDFETFSSKNWRNVLKAYNELVEERRLPVRVYEQCLFPDVNKLKEFIEEGYKTGVGNEYFKIGPLKLLTDGSLGMRTAYLEEPYSDDINTRGINVFSQDELDELSRVAHNNGMNLVYHAIGDGAINMCIKSFEKIQSENYKEDARFGLVHIQILSDYIVKKFKELNIVGYIEPICINTDLYIGESRVGKERLKTSYIYKRLIDEGINICISSDCPVDSLNPMHSLYVATTRKDYNGYPENGWINEEALSVEDVIYAFTMGSAYAAYEENIKGSIEEGKLADFVVLEKDITNINLDDIKDVKVEKTYLGGEEVFSINR